MPRRKEICAAAECGTQFAPTRKGCGGRQYVVEEYVSRCKDMLKDGAEVGDWICVTCRDTLRARAATGGVNTSADAQVISTQLRRRKRKRMNVNATNTNRNDDDDDGASVTDDSDYSTEPSDYEIAEWTSAADDDSGASSSGDVEDADESGSNGDDESAASVLVSMHDGVHDAKPHDSPAAAKRERDKLTRQFSREKKQLEVEQTLALKRSRSATNRLREKLANSETTVSTLTEEVQRMEDASGRQQTENDKLRHANRTIRRRLSQSRHYRGTVAVAKKELARANANAAIEIADLRVRMDGWQAEYERTQAELLLSGDGGGGGGANPTCGKPQTLSLLFENGQYSDAMRLAVFACLNANVGKDKIGPLVGAITQAVTNKQITRLPAPSTVASWAAELHGLTQCQLYDQLTRDRNAVMVLAHDGTTKHEDKLIAGAAHITRRTGAGGSTEKRESVALFVRKAVDGTAESGTRALNDALADVNAAGAKAFPGRVQATGAQFTGTLTDHNTTAKKTNELLWQQIRDETKASANTNLSLYCWNHKLENWANAIDAALATPRCAALDITHNRLVSTSIAVNTSGGVSIQFTACPPRVLPSTAAAPQYTAWRFIDTAVKLFRRGGNAYGHRIGSNHQKWCRLAGKRDTLKGMTRVRGVRPDARMKNAKPLLLTAANSIEAYWQWRATQRVSVSNGGAAEGDASENKLVSSVRADLRNPRIVAGLWLIAALSDGFFQPLMYAINEDDQHKSMLSMTDVLRRIRMSVSAWARGDNLPALFCGWLVGHCGVVSKYAPPTADVISGAFTLLDRATQIELACTCRRTHWNVQKMTRVSTVGLSCLLAALLTAIDHFTPEYRDGTLLQPAVQHIAGACPPNNDYVESTFGIYTHRDNTSVNMTPTHKEAHVLSQRNHTVEWALAQPPDQLASILSEVRQYRQSLPQKLKLRAARDDKLIRERSDQFAAAHAKQHEKRTKRKEALSQVPILKSIAALHAAVARHQGKTARLAFLKEQLNLYKYPPFNEKDSIRFSVQGVARTSEELKQLLESLIRKHFRDDHSAAGQTVNYEIVPRVSPAAAAAAVAAAVAAVAASAAASTAPAPMADVPVATDAAAAAVDCAGVAAAAAAPIKRRGRPPKQLSKHAASRPSPPAPSSSASSSSAASSSSSSSAAAAAAAASPVTATTASRTATSSSKRAAAPTLSCCGQPDNDGDLCVQCDTCRQWKHCECEGVDYEDAQDSDEFECQLCAVAAFEAAAATATRRVLGCSY